MSHAAETMTHIEWTHGGTEYRLAPRTLDAELLFSARHAAWLAGELDRIRDLIGERSYDARMAKQEEMRAAGRLVFGGDLSFQWLLSDEGMAEYAYLLNGEAGGPRTPKEALLRLAKQQHPDWGRLWRAVSRRDFPSRVNPAFLAEPSAPGATPPPSTAASTSP